MPKKKNKKLARELKEIKAIEKSLVEAKSWDKKHIDNELKKYGMS
ncbi:MAG: hypothetical protein ABIB04_03445 [Patescibacteria group bacterium]